MGKDGIKLVLMSDCSISGIFLVGLGIAQVS